MEIAKKSQTILKELYEQSSIKIYVDNTPVPQPFRGSGEIKLIILGQDPTVKDSKSRASIKTVLNLDKKGALRNYVNRICKGMGLGLDRDVYATNVVKNFFIRPPTQIDQEEKVNVLQVAGKYWFKLLQEEIMQFPKAAIISLGEPILSFLVTRDSCKLVKYYWGYKPDRKKGEQDEFKYLSKSQSVVGRAIFPFPHQPSIRKEFYKNTLDRYIAFMKMKCFCSNR